MYPGLVIPQTISFIPYFHPLRFSDDIEWMTGRRPNLYWQATWRVISPLMLLVVLLAYVVVQAQENPTYDAWNPDYVRTLNAVSLQIYRVLGQWLSMLILKACNNNFFNPKT